MCFSRIDVDVFSQEEEPSIKQVSSILNFCLDEKSIRVLC